MSDTDEVGVKLSRDVLLALCAIGWADGDLDRNEADGILRAAIEGGLDIEDLQEVEDATKVSRSLEKIDVTSLGPMDRMFVYATAVWLSRLDGHVDPEERLALRKLGEMLELPDTLRAHASAAADEVAKLPSGDRPDRYDFVRLMSRMRERLVEAKDPMD